MAVAKFYDSAALDAYSPSLIAAVQPTYDLGRLAARYLLDRLDMPGRPLEDEVLPIPIVAY